MQAGSRARPQYKNTHGLFTQAFFFFLRGTHTGDGVGGEALKGLTARTNGVQQELAAKRIKPTTYKVQFRVANAIHGRRCQ